MTTQNTIPNLNELEELEEIPYEEVQAMLHGVRNERDEFGVEELPELPTQPARPQSTQPDLNQVITTALGALINPGKAPIAGTITQGYDTPVSYIKGRDRHGGLDIAAPLGTPIPVDFEGEVIEAKPSGGWGNNVLVRGKDGKTRRYAHLSSFNVKPGQKVKPGDVIGAVGSTGKSTGPHLHYEITEGRQ